MAANLRTVMVDCQNEVWATDCTWAKALQNAFRAGLIDSREHNRLFDICLGVARPGLDTKDVIPKAIEQLDIITKRNQ